MMKNKVKVLFLLKILILLILSNSYAKENVISGEKNYSGNVELKGDYLIKQGTKINLQPGSVLLFTGKVRFSGTVKNKIIIKGAKDSLVRFVQSDAELQNVDIFGLEGIEFIESKAFIENLQFKDNKVGLKIVRNSQAFVKSTIFTGNEIGLAVELKSNCKIEDSKFDKNEAGIVLGQQGLCEVFRSLLNNNKVGVFINRDSLANIMGSKFTENVKGIDVYQNIGSKITANTFTKNKTGIFGEAFSQIDIEKNDFIENETAIDFLQVVTGKIRNNIFKNNNTAILLEKKSAPDIRNNTFEGNETGIICNFSSYPVITKNNFLNNRFHIKLGEFQSADFENRTGSLTIQLKEVVEKQSRRSGQFTEKQKKVYSGEVFAKNNYWDENTVKEFKTKENVSTIYDGFDLKEVTYEGYGDQKYAIDKVIYKPYLTTPVKINK
ncbi:MAG: right-handed parallel beta-helix repeat-containing protein [Proteobacteria bacterium]|nr:right-handed parallel beta-helix repeat-containing protein [Pseudomonadota bacterium]